MPNVAKCTVISVVTKNGVHNINYVGFCEQQNVRICEASLRISVTLWPNVKERDTFELPEYPNLEQVSIDGHSVRIPNGLLGILPNNRIAAVMPCG